MDKENTIIRRLYLNKWVRIPVKIIISMAISKIVFDFSEHVTKFRRRNPNPRFCGHDLQSPAAPYIPRPYIWYDTYDQYTDIKCWHKMNNDSLKHWSGFLDKRFVYVDHPYRQNRNCFDQLMFRAKQFSCSQQTKFYLINDLIKKQENIPQSIYKEIRQIHQDDLEINKPIIPKL